MVRHVFFALTFIPLAACTSIEAVRPDMHARPLPSRGDETAMINGMRAALTADGNPLECFRGKDLKPFRPKFVQGYRDFQESDAEFSACPTFTSLAGVIDTERVTKVREYLDSGFGLVDLYCSRFFIIAAETRQSRLIQRNSGSAFDTLVTTVMAALGTGQTGLGIVNHGFEAFDATYKNIDAAFQVAPDRDDLVALVTASQDKIRTESYTQDYKTYAGARSAIERYASKCTFDGMRDLVGTAVRNAAKAAKSEKAPEALEVGKTLSPPGDGKKVQAKPTTDADLLGTAVPG